MKKLLTSVAIVAALGVQTSAFAMGKDCGSAILQIQNKTAYAVTVGSLSGNFTIGAGDKTTADEHHTQHIAHFQSQCDSSNCTIDIGQVFGQHCTLNDVKVPVHSDSGKCKIGDATYDHNTSSCGWVRFKTINTMNDSYPTLVIEK